MMKPQYITNEQGERISVILSMDEYEVLLRNQSPGDLELSDEAKEILDLRLEDYYRNKKDGKEWDVIKSEILK